MEVNFACRVAYILIVVREFDLFPVRLLRVNRCFSLSTVAAARSKVSDFWKIPLLAPRAIRNAGIRAIPVTPGRPRDRMLLNGRKDVAAIILRA